MRGIEAAGGEPVSIVLRTAMRAGSRRSGSTMSRLETMRIERVSFIIIPPQVWEAAAGVGAERTRWLEELPARVAELERAWRLTVGQTFAGGTLAWVVAVVREEGSDAVLKITPPHAEGGLGGGALRHWDGPGVVRV